MAEEETLFSRLASRLSAQRERVQFLQIGAMDGLQFDPIHDLIISRGWQGLLVEPQPEHFESLLKAYDGIPGLRFANVAVGMQNKLETLYTITPETVEKYGLPSWLLGVSSLSKGHVAGQEAFLKQWGFSHIMQYVTELSVETCTLPQLLEDYPMPPPDVLQLDAEGLDYRILAQWDFHAHRPALVNMEFARLSEREKKYTTDTFLGHGYSISLQGLDILAVQPELL